MYSKLYPELAEIEKYMLEEPNYAFLMSYTFKNYSNSTPNSIVGRAYGHEAWATPKFEAVLSYIYSNLNVTAVGRLIAKDYRWLAKHLLANIAIQIAIDQLADKLKDGYIYTDPITDEAYRFWLDQVTALAFTSTGTDFSLKFSYSNLSRTNTKACTVWLGLNSPSSVEFQQNWKTWPVVLVTSKDDVTIQFGDVKLSTFGGLISHIAASESTLSSPPPQAPNPRPGHLPPRSPNSPQQPNPKPTPPVPKKGIA